ncbi:helix-turn-helix domain-containing protein [Solilutibacter silvestris]|uniref:helix-turn-helix domain-containing protein n=1 Tax=Solilutibacter silvestris TaxID=1645665 RepID=UPI00101ADE24
MPIESWCRITEQLGIAQQTITHYESGVSRITEETFAPAAQILDTSVEDLIGVSTKRRNGRRGPQPKIAQ